MHYQKSDPKKEAKKKQMTVFAGLGFEVISLMFGSVIIGRVLDNYFGTRGPAVISLVIMSFCLWIYHVIVMSKKMYKKNDSQDT